MEAVFILGVDASTPAEHLAKGSKLFTCSVCQEVQVFMAPSSQKAMSRGFQAICKSCVTRAESQGDELSMQGFLPEAIQEHERDLLDRRSN